MGYTLALLIPMALILGICILKNLFRSTARSLTSLVLIVLALLVTVPLTALAAGRASGDIWVIMAESYEEYLTQVEQDLPLAEPVARALITSVLSLLMFPILFVLARLVLLLISLPIRYLLLQDRMKWGHSKGIGAVIGVLSGGLIIVACFSPALLLTRSFSDGVAYAREDFSSVSSEEDGDILSQLTAARETYLLPLDQDPLASVLIRVGRPFFSLAGSCRVEESSIRCDAAGELDAFTEAALCATALTSDDNDGVAAALDGMARAAERSDALAALLAEATRGMSEAWMAGEPFLGMDAPVGGGVGTAMLRLFLEDFRDTTPESVPQDLRHMAEELRLMDLTDTGTDLVTLLTRLADGAENADPLLDEVMKGWMEVVQTVGAQEIGELISEQTGAAPDADAVAHLDELLTTLPELAKDEEAMTDHLMQISEDFGLSLDEETARLAATCLERLYR